ncbi:TPA: hypothetical protein ACX96U_003639 [Clostridium sporogenes]
MQRHRRKKSLNENLNYNLLIEYEKLFHYEDLLIRKLDQLKLNYDTKISSSKIFGIISVFIAVLGYTNEVIGIKMIKSINNYKEILYCIILLIPSILSMSYLLKFKKVMKSFKIDFLKEEHSQQKNFFKFIIKKAEMLYRDVEVPSNNNLEYQKLLIKYCLDNKIKIIFDKSDLQYYIDDYLKSFNKDMDRDISIFLSEIILSRCLINKNIKGTIYNDEFQYSINETNMYEFIIALSL